MESWIIYALLDALAAALATILAKIGLQNVDSITATALRSIVMTVFAVSIMLYFRGVAYVGRITSMEYIFIILSGVAGGLSWIFYFLALQKGDTSTVAMIDRSSILFIILFSVILLHEELTLKKAISVALIAIALYLLII
ncbi:EamA family transporter [Desulfurococcus amylolyticus]|uniref:Putative membrane protein n=1 Tax=Desulfurococcus amylolyticus DSM 16532 TaxID=768672 RepID=I3XT00_DESAM|nr:EamA family transporter [Desulfurococcus amylolyticus]AFL67074.1 putative membrane protein [Desulfurococcus amylolyticus DSM 16532]